MTKKNESIKNAASGAIVPSTERFGKQEGYNQDVESLKKSIEELQKNVKSQNIKLIEFLGIFTAILAFITISAKIVIDNLSTLNVLLVLPCFALILMLFVIGLDSFINHNNKWQFWTLFSVITIFYILSFLLIKFNWFGN